MKCFKYQITHGFVVQTQNYNFYFDSATKTVINSDKYDLYKSILSRDFIQNRQLD